MLRWLMLVATLAIATSCTPARHPPAHLTLDVPPPTAKTLLRQLALDVPDSDLPETISGNTPIEMAAAPAFSGVARSAQDAARAAECLTAAIYYEARSEPIDGQRAVAQVVLNRVRDRAFPKSICGVVYQGSERSTGCQFSFTCDGSMLHPREPTAWARAADVAQAALAGMVYAPVGAATFYHANYVLPWWAPSLNRIGAIGSHIFYRWKGALERDLSFRQQYAGAEPSIPAPAPAMLADAPVAGVETMAGVVIHRGEQHGGDPAVPTGPTPPVAAVAATVPVTTAGVRVHRNGFAHDGPGVEHGVVVGAESDPG
ncbi:cell wall hydrolase [Sphingomonas sp. LC-1]|uniref:cell wall hydrolase n=1 Tax=Sphingomonas sp. LC-1 TaxID=3110957 RepID=UPI0028E0A1C6|nr:cell wall hydrolase [Sphingomonas sp. LC-1]